MTTHNNIIVVGLGPDGLSLMRRGANNATEILGFDTDAVKIAQLSGTGGRFASDTRALTGADIFVLSTAASELEAACTLVGTHLSEGALVIIATPVAPGITEKTLLPLLERASHLSRHEFDVAHSPVTGGEVRPLAGFSERAHKAALSLFQKIGITTRTMRTIKEAEAAGAVLHWCRDVENAFAEELCLALEHSGIDTRALNLKPPQHGDEAVSIPNVFDLQMLSLANRISVRLSRRKGESQRISALNDTDEDHNDREHEENVDKSPKRVRRKKTDKP